MCLQVGFSALMIASQKGPSHLSVIEYLAAKGGAELLMAKTNVSVTILGSCSASDVLDGVE